MKKFILTLFALASLAIGASAQRYVGGSASFSIIGANGGTAVGFGLSPEVGYMFNDKMGVGGALNLSLGGGDGGTSFELNIAPYFRYVFAQAGKVKFFGDAIVPLGIVTGGGTSFAWGINLSPGIIVNAGGKWDIVAHLITLGYNGIAGKYSSGGVFKFDIFSGPSIGVAYSF